MTIIAYKDGVIAADRRITHGDTIWADARKIVKAFDGALVGGCGNLSFLQQFLDWAMAADREDYEPPKTGSKNQGLIVTENRIFYYAGPKPVIITAPYIAIGSGTDIALGAFWMGANAQQAVNAAISHNAYCGGGIDFLEK